MYFKVYKWLGKRRFILKFIDLLLFLGLWQTHSPNLISS
jgi:hypothetical protein